MSVVDLPLGTHSSAAADEADVFGSLKLLQDCLGPILLLVGMTFFKINLLSFFKVCKCTNVIIHLQKIAILLNYFWSAHESDLGLGLRCLYPPTYDHGHGAAVALAQRRQDLAHHRLIG